MRQNSAAFRTIWWIVADPDENWSLALYQREAYRVIDDILARGKLPFLVGGTGQYVRSIIEGWQIPPQKPDYDLRDALNHWADEIGAEGLYVRLKTIDADAAVNMDYRNVRRVVGHWKSYSKPVSVFQIYAASSNVLISRDSGD